MTARDFKAASEAVAVEQFNNGRKQGCIVRWDFEAVKNQVPTSDTRKSRRAAMRKQEGAEGATAEQQYTERDTGFVAFSVKVYHTLPKPADVVADIEADLAARYPDGNRPDIDIEQYRLAIENLHNLKDVE